MKIVFGGALLWCLFFLPATVTAQQQLGTANLGEMGTFEFEVRRWRSNLVSELRFSRPDSFGTDFDPVADLGLPGENTYDYHFGVRLTRRLKVRGNWFRTRYDSDIITERDLWIAGAYFPTSSTLSTKIELEMRRGGIEFDLLTGAYGYVAVVGEWARFSAKNEFTSPETFASPTTLRMDLPMFGFKSRIYLTPALAITAEGLGMKRESIGVMTDVDFGVAYNAIPSLALSYGYRNSYNRFKDIEPGSRAIYRLEGQYFGVTVRF